MNGLPRLEFYNRDVIEVARDLIGIYLVRRSRAGTTVGRIVETEAYLATGDSAAHSANGPNKKNASMFGPAGRAYVYTIHARQCVNVVTEAKGSGSAVLIRALEPVSGIDLMKRRRRTDKLRDLCRGPARLCEAFDIGRSFDGWSLLAPNRLWLTADWPVRGKKSDDSTAGSDNSRLDIATSVRIGVTSAAELPLRFFAAGNRFVSGPAKLNRQKSSACPVALPRTDVS